MHEIQGEGMGESLALRMKNIAISPINRVTQGNETEMPLLSICFSNLEMNIEFLSINGNSQDIRHLDAESKDMEGSLS